MKIPSVCDQEVSPFDWDPLNCRGDLFFEDIPQILEEQKSLYNRVFTLYNHVFTIEGDIFEGFVLDWAPFKKLILQEIDQGVWKLKTFIILDVPDNVVLKVASTVAVTEKMGSKLGGSTRS